MMGKGQRIVTTVLWALAVVGMLGLVGSGLWATKQTEARVNRPAAGDEPARLASAAGEPTDGDGAGALPAYFDAPAFALTDQNNRTVTDESLRGSVWVAMVFFTNCNQICPGMVGRLKDLQDSVKDPRVKLVSFTLDPERDTPEQLRQYAERLGADASRWFLLTGPKEQMFAAAHGLKLSAAPAEGDKPITHTGKMLLVDPSGRVRGVYDSADDASMKKLADDAAALAAQAAAQERPS